MAPTSLDDLERVVFSTRIQMDQIKNEWQDLGALEIGHGKDDNGAELLTVLYRGLKGSIFDITTTIQMVAKADDDTFDLCLDAKSVKAAAMNIRDLQNGFSIQIRDFFGNDPVFHGTLGGSSWQGRSCGVSKTPLSVMREEKKEIPSDVRTFLGISPVVMVNGNIIDQPHEWGKDIFQDVMLQCLPDVVKEHFFPDLKPLGTFFAEKDLSGSHLPSILQDPNFKLSLYGIGAYSDDMFRLCGLHLLCENLKRCDWLDQTYKDKINDKCALYFEILTCPEDEVTIKVAEYGPDTYVGHEVAKLRSDYADAIEKCYLAAYLCSCPDLASFVGNAESLYAAVKDAVSSQNYKAHWLPETVDASNNNKAELMKTHLAILHDKLVFLLAISGKTRSEWTGPSSEIGKVIEDLGIAAKTTGLYGVTNMTLPPENFVFMITPGRIFSDDQQWHLQIQDIWDASQGSDLPVIMVRNVDYRSETADNYLSGEPADLGLYTKVVKGSQCTIL